MIISISYTLYDMTISKNLTSNTTKKRLTILKLKYLQLKLVYFIHIPCD